MMFPNFKRPQIKMPQLKIPSFELPKIRILWPQFRLPEFRLPELKIPAFKIPKPRMPQIEFPKFSMPQLKVPSFKLPALTLPKFKRRTPSPEVFRARQYRRIRFERTVAAALFCSFVIAAFSIGFVTQISVKAADLFPFASRNIAFELNSLIPAAGDDGSVPQNSSASYSDDGRYQIEDSAIDVEAVLIPRDTTVISSSQDSKIKAINFDNGELFKKGDILVEYECKDIRAEVEIAKTQQALTAKQASTSHKLFKLDIISSLEKMEIDSENKQAKARIDLYESRMDACFIRADYDGRVVKRLANAGEFTRTDRVLMEVASLNHLKAEFLLPSRWLRWINVGAPITIQINETGKTYDAAIKHIYGEVDPVSQSVQVTAQLDPYEDALLPGMSGTSTIDLNAVREAGIYGFLEKTPQEPSEPPHSEP